MDNNNTTVKDKTNGIILNEAGDILDKKLEAANKCVIKHTTGSMALGLIPIPLLDLAGLIALQLKMLHALSRIYEVEFVSSMGTDSIRRLAGSITPVSVAVPIVASMSKFIPIIGQTLSSSSLIILNGAATYGIGKVFEKHFSQGGSFLDFEIEKMNDYFADQYEKGKGVVSDLMKNK